MVAYHTWSNGPAGNLRKVFIAVPCGGELNARTAFSISKLTAELERESEKFTLGFELGNCHVDDARNNLVHQFLKTDCTELFFVDSDVVFEPGEFLKILKHDVGVVGATYPYKDDSGDFPCEFRSIAFADEETGLVQADGMPTGFLKIKRQVFESIRPLVPEYFAKGTPGEKIAQFFDRGIENNVRVGGDIRFCHLCAQSHIKVFCDPKVYLGHTGRKTFEGEFYWKQSLIAKGYYPTLSDAFKEDRWHNKRVLEDLQKHWDNGAFQGSAQYIQACCLFAERFCKEKPALEMGAGLSTVFLGLLAREKGFHLTSLEEDRMWMGKVWGALEDAGANVSTDIRHTPTKENYYNVPKDFYEKKYGIVCVDGPCGVDNKNGRRQSLEFDSDCYVFDDANRPQIMECVAELENRGYNSTIVDATKGRIVLVAVREELCTS